MNGRRSRLIRRLAVAITNGDAPDLSEPRNVLRKIVRFRTGEKRWEERRYQVLGARRGRIERRLKRAWRAAAGKTSWFEFERSVTTQARKEAAV
jgi:hypothetical protein